LLGNIGLIAAHWRSASSKPILAGGQPQFRFSGEADTNWQASLAELIENDPKRHFVRGIAVLRNTAVTLTMSKFDNLGQEQPSEKLPSVESHLMSPVTPCGLLRQARSLRC
jgi:hypothetical protein